MAREIQKFMVSIKALIMDGDKLLVLQENTGRKRWELPGGRIDIGEELLDSRDILHREIAEELGDQLRYSVHRPVITWARQFQTVTGEPTGEFIFFVGYLCNYESGKIVLSDEHAAYQWVEQSEVSSLQFAAGYGKALDEFWKNR